MSTGKLLAADPAGKHYLTMKEYQNNVSAHGDIILDQAGVFWIVKQVSERENCQPAAKSIFLYLCFKQ